CLEAGVTSGRCRLAACLVCATYPPGEVDREGIRVVNPPGQLLLGGLATDRGQLERWRAAISCEGGLSELPALKALRGADGHRRSRGEHLPAIPGKGEAPEVVGDKRVVFTEDDLDRLAQPRQLDRLFEDDGTVEGNVRIPVRGRRHRPDVHGERGGRGAVRRSDRCDVERNGIRARLRDLDALIGCPREDGERPGGKDEQRRQAMSVANTTIVLRIRPPPAVRSTSDALTLTSGHAED